MKRTYIRGKTAKSAVFYLAVSIMICVGLLYALHVPSVPVVVISVKTRDATTTRGVLVIKDVFVVRVNLTTSVSTSRIILGDDDYEVTVHLTIYETLTENYKTTITSWSEHSVIIAEAIRTTSHQTLAEAYPTLSPMLTAALVVALVMILAGGIFGR
jgi:hypothetical protein